MGLTRFARIALGRRRIWAESWRRCEQGSARRPTVLPHRSVGVPLPARPAGAENIHPSGRQTGRRPQRPPHSDRIPPLADDRLPARLRELPRLRIGPRAGGGFPPSRASDARSGQRRSCRRLCRAETDQRALRPLPLLSRRPASRGRHGRHVVARFRHDGRGHPYRHGADRISRARRNRRSAGLGPPARGLPDRPPRRRPVAGLFVL